MNPKGRQKTKLTNGMHRGFQRGWAKVQMGDEPRLRRKLKSIIGGSTRAKLIYWRNGRTIIYPEPATEIEKAFAEFGITDIWDE